MGETSNGKLSVFEVDSIYHVVAESAGEALRLLAYHLGESVDDYPDWYAEPLDDDHVLSILIDENGCISDSGATLRLTCREWVGREGRGYLASTEF